MIEIKQASEHDVEVLALLGRVTWIETFGALFHNWEDVQDYANETFSIKTLRSFIENPKGKIWVAYYNGIPIGYSKIELGAESDQVKGNNICKLVNIYVLHDFHSKKIGSLLLSKVLDEVVGLQCDKLWLSVLHTNTKAINLYKKNNFYTAGTFDYIIGANSFIMNTMVRDFNVDELNSI
ncbi:GNAT family N-acetyltransferase [Formosa sp. PL04]|uniref:GNAT family N-acetyltransferase n=1 Tax=Formosa sp. PL04 TaxID=3081755 RepID=UPI0029817868|nr:GNAT family N-acetyltransferase [Formosa sp. PL04]MDW5289632.1 GNAT family N-acetyltransferase [Formosa sp. PL04]